MMPDHVNRKRVLHAVMICITACTVFCATGCYRKVIRAEGFGARTANPRVEESSVPKSDPVGDFLFGPRTDSSNR